MKKIAKEAAANESSCKKNNDILLSVLKPFGTLSNKHKTFLALRSLLMLGKQ